MGNMPISLLSRGPADTQALAGGIAQMVEGGDLVLLSGELGAGKTAFSQGFGAGLGVEQRITSPTFILVQSYNGRIPMHHVDAYRLDSIEEAVDLGMSELLDSPGVTVVEWGERIRSTLPADLLDIRIEYGDELNDRLFELTPIGTRWMARLGRLEALAASIPITDIGPTTDPVPGPTPSTDGSLPDGDLFDSRSSSESSEPC